MKHVAPLMLLPLLLLGGGKADVNPVATNALDPIEIQEWPVPWERTRPRDPYVDGQGRVWFCGQAGGYIAYLEPETGEFKRYEMYSGAAPHNLIVDDEGYVWYAGNRNAHIGKLDPKTGEITKYPMPEPDARDPHTLVFDHNGDIWFTLQGANMIGKLMVESGDVHVIRVPNARSRPYGIKVDSNGRPWIALFGTNKLATIDPETMELREIALPHAGARPRRLEITSDDKIWYVDYARGFLGRYDPASGEFQEWASPGGTRARAYGMALDDQDRVWFVESGLDPNQFIGFDTHSREFFSVTAISSGAGTVRHMYFHKPTRTIWFGTDANTIGRARVP